ncbi:MAG: hypothetical protein RJA44_2364 [Pseudomonadota bacterium]|jgi:hypothetical protein
MKADLLAWGRRVPQQLIGAAQRGAGRLRPLAARVAPAAGDAAAAPPPRPATATAALDEPLLLEWCTLGGLLIFATWLLGVRGVWRLLLSSDPTGLTLVIIVVCAVSTLWCGSRSRELQRQRRLLERALAARRAGRPEAAPAGWASDYWAALALQPRDAGAPLDLLVEQAQGPHHTAWWVNGIQLKLGLLGKVIGFSMLAMQIGQLQNFDAAQSQDLLRSLTSGLGVALLTTMVGLVGNIVLGLQLTRLDRYADALISDCQRHGLAIGAGAAGEG